MSERGRRRTPVTQPAQTASSAAVPSPASGTGDDALLVRLRHELRTPINAIIGYAEMILEEGHERPNADLEPYITRIVDEGRALLALVNKTLYGQSSGATAHEPDSIFDGPLRDDFDASTLSILDACEWLQRSAAKASDEALDADLRKIALAAARVRAIVSEADTPFVAPPDDLWSATQESVGQDIPQRPRTPGEPGHVLIVDDQAINRELLSRRLVQDGYTVAAAASGREALERVLAEPFDIVLLDVMMPETSGFEVLSRLKSHPRTRHLPVLMISALDEMQSVVRCIEMGADDYLTTPIDPILLRARISSSLERKRLHDDELAYIEAIRRETDASRVLEDGMLPRELPRVRGVEMAAAVKPAQEVAGDFYEVVRLPGDRVAIALGDVRSSRADTRLFIALTRSVLRTFAERLAAGKRVDPLDVMLRINGYVRRESASTSVSLLFLVLEPKSGVIHYVNAGHVPPVILDATGIKTILIPTGPAVGSGDDSAFARESAELAPGDCLLLYSDGITEAQNAAGAVFSDERLHAILEDGALSPTALLARVQAALSTFAGSAPLVEDVTLIAIRQAPSD